VVLFGPADHGKSTVIGYMYANSLQMDMDSVERNLRDKLGNRFNAGYLYSSLLNTEHNSRFNTRLNGLRRILDFTFIDTPGHEQYLSEREQGISMGEIGIFCLAINEVLNDKFEEAMDEFTDLWFEHYATRRLICLLTKFDLLAYSQDDYEKACERVISCCRRVMVERSDNVFGVDIDFDVPEPGFAAIIPVAVLFDKRDGVNIISHSEKTPWYRGPLLVEAIRERENDLPDV